ncbi:type I-E CRISPR-associated protein Cse1/CasA (plasmid) [Streptomyces californicus]|uniref:type I-E CRISPR-associated protein Cse1/CasA n=1 Tax=Streptomyces californicus TaxID=67351 RepID=UPI00195F8725|nr:type I-E CRISPR-associated protein Cse1/CasA [Streptomyces californicus]
MPPLAGDRPRAVSGPLPSGAPSRAASTFPLTTSPWIPVADLDTNTHREVGLTEALVRADRLVYHASLGSESIALLRLMAAALDAACGPRSVAE